MASDEDIQEAILGVVIDEFRDANSMISIGGESIIEEVTGSLTGVSDSDVQYHLDRLNDDFCIDLTKTTGEGIVELEASGIDTYEELSGDIVIPPGNIDDILEVLYEHERDNPGQPHVSREGLADKTELSEEELDRTIWYMKEKRLVDAQTSIGQPWWHAARITDKGRRIHET